MSYSVISTGGTLNANTAATVATVPNGQTWLLQSVTLWTAGGASGTYVTLTIKGVQVFSEQPGVQYAWTKGSSAAGYATSGGTQIYAPPPALLVAGDVIFLDNGTSNVVYWAISAVTI